MAEGAFEKVIASGIHTPSALLLSSIREVWRCHYHPRGECRISVVIDWPIENCDVLEV